jgi:hypothetical protein
MIAAVIMLLSVAVKAQSDSDPSGIWSYSCPDAPYEYQTGKVEFVQDNGVLKLKLFVGASTTAPGYAVEKKGTSYICNYVIDNMDIVLTLARSGGNLSGTVSTDQWEMPITLKPLPK